MSPEFETVRLTWPWSITCQNEAEAVATHKANAHSTRKGLVVTFHRTTQLTFKGPKPHPLRRTSRPPDDPVFDEFRPPFLPRP